MYIHDDNPRFVGLYQMPLAVWAAEPLPPERGFQRVRKRNVHDGLILLLLEGVDPLQINFLQPLGDGDFLKYNPTLRMIRRVRIDCEKVPGRGF